MNPTDQWRKESRKKELKKNKKQRVAVREAVIKTKSPAAIIKEIEDIEQQGTAHLMTVAIIITFWFTEVDATQLPTEKALKEKKRKLIETLERILSYYKKEDPEKCAEVKKMIAESELRRRENLERCQSYQAARSQYAVSDIPLPDANDIPMPELDTAPLSSPPGPPPGPPPDDLLAVLGVVELEGKQQKSVRFAPQESNDASSNDNGDVDTTVTTTEPGTITVRPPPPPPGLPPARPLFPPSGMTTLPPPPPGLPPPAGNFVLLPGFSRPRQQQQPHIQSQPVLKTPLPEDTIGSATISAQPQIRNIQAEVTKFMPTSLKVRRDQPKAARKKFHKTQDLPNINSQYSSSKVMQHETSDAYETFMKEMDGLL